MNTDRRSLLKTGVVGLAAAVPTSLAGCLNGESFENALGSGSSSSAVSVPETGAPTYRDWLPAPGELPATGDGAIPSHYDFSHLSFERLRARESQLPGSGDGLGVGVRGLFARAARFFLGLSFRDIDTVTKVGMQNTILTGSLDYEAVRVRLTSSGFEAAGSHGGFQLYTHQMGVAALSEGVILTSTEPTTATARESLETIIDAKRGDVPRYHEGSEDCRALTDALGSPTLSWVWTSDPVTDTGGMSSEYVGSIGHATGLYHGSDAAYQSHVVGFRADDDDENRAAAAATIRDDQSRQGQYEDNTVTTDGRFVRLDGRVAYDDYAEFAGTATAELQPVTTWWFDFDGVGSGGVTVHHEAGETIRADQLTVLVDGTPANEQFVDSAETVEPGDTLELSGEVDGRVRIVWESSDRASSGVLAAYDPTE
ncbi:hypothetical protein [Haloarchaeobius sp. DFWS5]|uniref:hypothetical protein n=1 Tax=Haloarchaeobius sp. DFWS5 TaxID=3446114 RepID=UPI003EC070E8